MDQSISLDIRLARRLAALRSEHGWSLEDLAERSGISRTTLSRLERVESSPTAELLGKLCTVYGRTMSGLIAEAETSAAQLLRSEEQMRWTDTSTGFQRRLVSPPAQTYKAEMIEGTLPPGAVIQYQAPPVPGMEQHIWMLAGSLLLTVEQAYQLHEGDSLRFRLYGPSRFESNGDIPARYVIVICH